MKATRPAHLSYDWDNHRKAPAVIRSFGEHVVIDGDEATYQAIGARLLTPQPSLGYTIRPTCAIPRCAAHVRVIPPVRPDYAPFVCVYCGEPADTFDHLVPRIWTGESDRRRVAKVPACRQCNSAIGDRYAPTMAERRSLAHAHLRRRYKKYLGVVMRGPSDLAQMGRALRAATKAAMREHDRLMARLAWPTEIDYDARAWSVLDDEDRQ